MRLHLPQFVKGLSTLVERASCGRRQHLIPSPTTLPFTLRKWQVFPDRLRRQAIDDIEQEGWIRRLLLDYLGEQIVLNLCQLVLHAMYRSDEYVKPWTNLFIVAEGTWAFSHNERKGKQIARRSKS